jgi:hypothetical protein
MVCNKIILKLFIKCKINIDKKHIKYVKLSLPAKKVGILPSLLSKI